MKLVDKNGNEIKPGDTVTTFRGEKAKLVSFRPPHKLSSTGHVFIRSDDNKVYGEFYPSVIGATIIDD